MMRTFIKAVWAAVCLLLIVVTFCGCWSRRELDTLAITLGIGFDKGTYPNETMVTLQVAQAGRMNHSSQAKEGRADDKAYLNVSNSSINVFSTVREISQLLSRRPYFPHNQVMIFGGSLANEDIRPYLDLFLRDQEARLNVYIMVTKGSAADILSVEPSLEKIPSMELSGLAENRGATSQSINVELFDFISAVISDTTDPVAPVVSISDSHSDKKLFQLQEIAMFSDGKIAGYLDETESRGFCWITDKIESGSIDCEMPGGLVTMEIIRSSCRIKPVLREDGSFAIEADVSILTVINNQYTKEDLTMPGMLELIAQRQDEVIRKEMMSALSRAQEVKCDIFGFGEAIHKKYPKQWKTIMKDWDEIFPTIELEVNINSQIKDSGGIMKPVYPQKEVTLSGD